MDKWAITIEAWPHSSGQGHDKDQESCGPRTKIHHTRANNIEQAMMHAKLIAEGIERNPMVWQAPITAIQKVRE